MQGTHEVEQDNDDDRHTGQPKDNVAEHMSILLWDAARRRGK
jgi:hypothetical protein